MGAAVANGKGSRAGALTVALPGAPAAAPVPPALHFTRVEVRRLAGIDGPFCVDGLSPGINVIYGPNGCGKSRTAAAINALLWPGAAGGAERASLRGGAVLGGQEWRIDLDAGAVAYQRDGSDAGPPPLPSADVRDRYNLPLHELLRDGAAADFAETILRESAGGFDLKAAAEALGARPAASNPRKEVEALKAADRAVKEADTAQRAVLDEEQKVAELEASLCAARRAAARAEALRRARECRAARDALEAAEAALRQFPPGVEKLRGDELESVARLRRESDDARAAAENALREIERCDAKRRECRVGEEGLADDLLKLLSQRHQRLAGLRTTLDARRGQLDGAAAQRAKAKAQVSPSVSDEQLARVSAGTMSDLAAFARDWLNANAAKAARDALAEWVGAAQPAANLDQLNYGLRLLWRWLATPAPASPPDRSGAGARVALVVASLAIVLQAAALAWLVHWAFAALAAAAGVVLALSRRAGGAAPADDARAVTASEFAKLNLGGPGEWTAECVAEAADALAQQAAAARADAEKAARWASLGSKRKQLDDVARRVDVRRQFFAAHFGVAPDADPLSLVVLASNVALWQEADARLAAAQAEYDAALEQYGDELQAAAELLRPHGYDAGDVAQVAAAAESLRERQAAFREATQRRESAAERQGEAERQAAAAEARLESLYGRLDLDNGDEQALGRWCERRAEYDAAKRAADRAAVALQLADSALAGAPELRDAAPADVEAQLLDAEREAARAAGLNDELVRIATTVDAAKKAASVEEALSRQGECLAALAARREDDCRGTAAWALVEYLRKETRDRHRPAVFHRARELFSRVTQGRYRLDFDDASDAPTFRAADTSSGAGHSLDELSGGTRLQLLLAVRVAFVEEQERGVRLPVLLDEALANSDETRARAIIDATIAIARSGRQVFYFTAQLDEVAKWKAIVEDAGDVPHRLIDLAEVRGLAATERLPLREIRPLELPKVPDPYGLTRQEYGEVLKVPALGLSRREAGATHLWHLIDDTAVLHGFLKLGVNTWGQLKTLGEFNGAALVNGSRDALRRAAAAAKALEALAEAWQVGRGRPVDRQVVLDSRAVTQNFVEPVCALAQEVGGDAVRLVGRLDAGAVPWFRKEALANLRAYLVDNGYIDERPTLPPEQVRGRMLAAAAEEIAQGWIDAGRLDAYLSHAGAGAAVAPAPAVQADQSHFSRPPL